MVVLEIAGIAAIGVVVLILFRAASARPEDNGLRMAAWIALSAWLAFALFWLIDLDDLQSDPWSVVINGVLLAIVIGVVLGYRKILKIIKSRTRDHIPDRGDR